MPAAAASAFSELQGDVWGGATSGTGLTNHASRGRVQGGSAHADEGGSGDLEQLLNSYKAQATLEMLTRGARPSDGSGAAGGSRGGNDAAKASDQGLPDGSDVSAAQAAGRRTHTQVAGEGVSGRRPGLRQRAEESDGARGPTARPAGETSGSRGGDTALQAGQVDEEEDYAVRRHRATTETAVFGNARGQGGKGSRSRSGSRSSSSSRGADSLASRGSGPSVAGQNSRSGNHGGATQQGSGYEEEEEDGDGDGEEPPVGATDVSHPDARHLYDDFYSSPSLPVGAATPQWRGQGRRPDVGQDSQGALRLRRQLPDSSHPRLPTERADAGGRRPSVDDDRQGRGREDMQGWLEGAGEAPGARTNTGRESGDREGSRDRGDRPAKGLRAAQRGSTGELGGKAVPADDHFNYMAGSKVGNDKRTEQSTRHGPAPRSTSTTKAQRGGGSMGGPGPGPSSAAARRRLREMQAAQG